MNPNFLSSQGRTRPPGRRGHHRAHGGRPDLRHRHAARRPVGGVDPRARRLPRRRAPSRTEPAASSRSSSSAWSSASVSASSTAPWWRCSGCPRWSSRSARSTSSRASRRSSSAAPASTPTSCPRPWWTSARRSSSGSRGSCGSASWLPRSAPGSCAPGDRAVTSTPWAATRRRPARRHPRTAPHDHGVHRLRRLRRACRSAVPLPVRGVDVNAGRGYELPVVAACVVGGVAHLRRLRHRRRCPARCDAAQGHRLGAQRPGGRRVLAAGVNGLLLLVAITADRLLSVRREKRALQGVGHEQRGAYRKLTWDKIVLLLVLLDGCGRAR